MDAIFQSLGLKMGNYPCKGCMFPFEDNTILKHLAHASKCSDKYSKDEIEVLKQKSASRRKKKKEALYQSQKDIIAENYKNKRRRKKKQVQLYKKYKYLHVKPTEVPTVSNVSSKNNTDSSITENFECKICKKVLKSNTIMKHLAKSFNCKENYNLKDLQLLKQKSKEQSMCKKNDWKKQHYSSATRALRYQQNKDEIAKDYQNNKSEISKKRAESYNRQLRKKQLKDREEKHMKLVDTKMECEYKKWWIKWYNEKKNSARRNISDISYYQSKVEKFKLGRSFSDHITQELEKLELVIADKFKKWENETFKVFREIDAVLGPLGPCNKGDDENHFKDIMFCNLDFYVSFEKRFLSYHIKDKLKEISSELGEILEVDELEEKIRVSTRERLKKTDAERLQENENGFYATKNHLKLSFDNIKRTNYSSNKAWRIAVAKKCSVEFCSCHYSKTEEFDLSCFSNSRV